MVSSLSEQLARSASVNANILDEKARKQTQSESYLFSPKEARQHDLESIHALGVNGFLQLKSLQPAIAPFEQQLFSDAAKSLDRTLQTEEQNKKLNATISAFLPLLGPFLLDSPTGKILEWLVRRFRIHEFNVEAVVALFIPYHETPHFVKMVSILHIQDRSTLRFLRAFKATAKPLHRHLLINEMLKSPGVARFVSGILPGVLNSHSAGLHRPLIAFHTGVLLEFVGMNRALDENAMAIVLPAALEPLQVASNVNVQVKPALLQESIASILGSYLILAAISQKTHLTANAVKSIMLAATECAQCVSPKQLIRTLVSIAAPQDELERLSGGVIKTLVRMPDITSELIDAMAWTGAEKVIVPLLKTLLTRLDDTLVPDIVEALITSQALPGAIARSAAMKLIRELMDLGDAPSTSIMRQLLSQLHQRYPKAVERASRILIEENPSQTDAIERLILSLSFSIANPCGAEAETSTLLVGSASVDAAIRAHSVRELLARLSSDNLPDAEKQSICSTLMLRVHDDELSVLKALYTHSADVAAKALLSNSPAAYLDALAQVLHGSGAKPSRDVIRVHFSFLLSHFVPSLVLREDAESFRKLTRRIAIDIVLPFLLYTKPRMKTAQTVWDIIEAAEDAGLDPAVYELLGGCAEAVRWEKRRPDAGTKDNESERASMDVALMTRINLAVAAKIADNILASNYFQQHLDSILAKLHDEDPHARSLVYLISRALLSRIGGEQRIDTAHYILRAMQLETLEGMGDFMHGVNDVSSFLNDNSVGAAVVLKPSSQNTLHRLQVAVLSVLPSIPRPSGARLDWVTQHSAASGTEAARYVLLLRDVYRLSNSSAHLALLSTHLLRSLFVNLGDDALAFLAGLWLASSSDTHSKVAKDESHVQYAALRHAGAFLEAHVVTQRTVDFQTVLPAMLVMLQSQDASVREAAIRCTAVVTKISSTKEAEAVYAFDAIYGDESAKLQYADWADFQKYSKAIGEMRDNLVHDPEYLQAFHREHLGQSKTDSKKTAGYKQRILCYLLSHVNACPLPQMKFALLKSLDGVSNEAKARVLMPTIETLASEQATRDLPPGGIMEDLVVYAVSAFDSTAAADLNNDGKTAWAVYDKLLTKALKDGHWERPCTALLHRLQHGLFSKLSLERKMQLCQRLLRIAVEDDSSALICKKVLASALSDVDLILRLLVKLQPTGEDITQHASKRPRIEKSTYTTQIEEISLLSTLIEVLGSLKVSGSLELISCLLETLHNVTHTIASDTADKRFVEQLIMSAVENFVQQFQDSTVIPPGSLRVDALVDILRRSENPQSFHQASLLLASLARIAPDPVLHNIMPIFTFMGSNVFHRDDSYTFRVVQKTIDSIVPVMVASLKGEHGTGMHLYLAARDFLRLFTTAANHVPRHRRVHFFSHLIDTLGPSDFLAPVIMLLVDRVANRVARQNSAEVVGSLFLPLAVTEHYQTALQLPLFIELVHEVERLTQSSGLTTKPFLEDAPDDGHPHAETSNKRRAIALLVFCDNALQRVGAGAFAISAQESTQSKSLLALLLSVATARTDDLAYAEVASAARSAMTSTLQIMSAPDFVAGICTILQSSSANAQAGALELFASRLTEVAEKTRRQLTPSIIKIVESIHTLFSASQDFLRRPALRALATVSETLSPGEEGSIASTVPLVLDAVRQETLRVPAFKALLSFSSRLGPRTIPYLKEIVKESVTHAREAVLVTAADSELIAAAVEVFRNLLSSIPTFWGEADLLQVVELYLDASDISESAEMRLLVKTVAKRASPTVLLPALCEMWERSLVKQAKDRPKRILSFIQVVKLSVKAASRPAVLDHLRELFKAFLSMFDLCADSQNAEMERNVTAAFIELVVKLNETAFRPIFRKMFDWAFNLAQPNRRAVFCHVYSALLEFFKALMVPYMSFAWQSLVETLRGYTSSSAEDGQLWLALVQTLSKSMAADDDRVFWRSDKLRQLVPLAAQQVPVAVRLNLPEGRDALAECLVSLLGITDDDVLSKSLNLDILMHSRSDDARVRLLSLTCAERLWRSHGEKLLGFVAETATFIAEAAEDENDLVVREAHKLKAAVEAVGGSIDVS
ncbi:armadillo-type protein [Trametes punicea]|nr:armadillo-type protein [Trametes punicea]